MEENMVQHNVNQVTENRDSKKVNADVSREINRGAERHAENNNRAIHSTSFQEKSNQNKATFKQTIDCVVVFLTDSNLHKINVDIMNHGKVAQKIFCPQIRDIEYIIENNAIKRKPLQIYIYNAVRTMSRGQTIT